MCFVFKMIFRASYRSYCMASINKHQTEICVLNIQLSNICIPDNVPNNLMLAIVRTIAIGFKIAL